MAARALAVNGVGLGVCGESVESLDFDAWRFSVGVTRRGDTDAAIQVVSGVLRRWGVGHHFGVSVRGIDCAVPL